ncbi:MAG: histidine kinase dimerization/phospho-acceptor domain-containing protein, partial [Candidatus Bathyarchaeia archaeon]
GKPGWAELIATPIKDEKGNVIAALELSVDITEKKLLQNKLKEYSERLEQLVEERTRQLRRAQAKLVKAERLATIGELAAMVGHDLRNPLTGIVGAAYYLKTKYGAKLGVKGKEMLETIEKAIENSNKIINDLLEYSQDLKLDCTEGSLKSILQDALSRVNIPEQIRVVDATDAGLKFKGDMEKMSNVFFE